MTASNESHVNISRIALKLRMLKRLLIIITVHESSTDTQHSVLKNIAIIIQLTMIFRKISYSIQQ